VTTSKAANFTFSRPGQGLNGTWVAEQFIGRRVRCGDGGYIGTITGVVSSRGGCPHYVVEWEPGAPEGLSNEVAPSAILRLIEKES